MTLAPPPLPTLPPHRAVPRAGRLLREARLRPGAARQYPWIEPGRWQPAALLADQVLAGRLLRGTHAVTCCRVLPDAHFEFRGGAARAKAGAGHRPRREDR